MDTKDNLVELGLRRPSGQATAVMTPQAASEGPLAVFVDRLLALLLDLPPDAETRDTDKFREKVEGFRAAAADPSRRMELPRVIEACMMTCEAYFRTSQKYHK